VTSIRFNFEWDPVKAQQNQRKHKVGFEQASTVFLDPLAISVFDDDHSEDEDRWATLGQATSGDLLVVIHTFRTTSDQEMTIRIISARRAAKRERLQYETER
jgi:uncharacterized DUF497 family protein